MWASMKRWFSTPQPLDETKVFKQLCKLQDAQIETNKTLAQTLDRMVTLRFDQPLKAKPMSAQPDNSPPRGFSGDLFSVEDDRKFHEAVDGMLTQ